MFKQNYSDKLCFEKTSSFLYVLFYFACEMKLHTCHGLISVTYQQYWERYNIIEIIGSWFIVCFVIFQNRKENIMAGSQLVIRTLLSQHYLYITGFIKGNKMTTQTPTPTWHRHLHKHTLTLTQTWAGYDIMCLWIK